jgi:hypothetical protein
MITAAKLGGFFAAHAIWSISEGERLIPMLGYTTESDERTLERFAGEDLAVAVQNAKARLAGNPMDANDAALLYDGRITIGEEKLDAILVELRAYFSPQSEAVLAVPYTPPSSGAFRVHRPKLLVWRACEDFDRGSALAAFFEGVDSHERGAQLWNACLDESK